MALEDLGAIAGGLTQAIGTLGNLQALQQRATQMRGEEQMQEIRGLEIQQRKREIDQLNKPWNVSLDPIFLNTHPEDKEKILEYAKQFEPNFGGMQKFRESMIKDPSMLDLITTSKRKLIGEQYTEKSEQLRKLPLDDPKREKLTREINLLRMQDEKVVTAIQTHEYSNRLSTMLQGDQRLQELAERNPVTGLLINALRENPGDLTVMKDLIKELSDIQQKMLTVKPNVVTLQNEAGQTMRLDLNEPEEHDVYVNAMDEGGWTVIPERERQLAPSRQYLVSPEGVRVPIDMNQPGGPERYIELQKRGYTVPEKAALKSYYDTKRGVTEDLDPRDPETQRRQKTGELIPTSLRGAEVAGPQREVTLETSRIRLLELKRKAVNEEFMQRLGLPSELMIASARKDPKKEALYKQLERKHGLITEVEEEPKAKPKPAPVTKPEAKKGGLSEARKVWMGK